jgi:hypothetical protein
MGDGIKTITMGTLPLALFGPEGFGARLGWIAFIRMSVNSSSPFLFAWITEAYGGWTSFFGHGIVYTHGAWCAVLCKAAFSVTALRAIRLSEL